MTTAFSSPAGETIFTAMERFELLITSETELDSASHSVRLRRGASALLFQRR